MAEIMRLSFVGGEALTASKGWLDQAKDYLTAVMEDAGEAGIISGAVVAEARLFSTPGRGRFTEESLSRMLELWPSNGLTVAAQHPGWEDDGLFKHLGRMRNPRLSLAHHRRNNRRVQVPAIRADLVFDPAAKTSPLGDLPAYIMQRVKSDPESLAMSLVLAVDKIQETDDKGRPLRGRDGEPLPPVWMPTELFEVDIVHRGDAVTAILSKEPDESETPYEPDRDAELERWRRRAKALRE